MLKHSVALLACALSLSGCIVDPSRSTPTVTTSVVPVDTGLAMTASPGNGVGVFVEYAGGGQWHLWWTCDTYVSGSDCDFLVNVRVVNGSRRMNGPLVPVGTNVNISTLSDGFEATSLTSTDLVETRFSTDPGATIEVYADVDGNADPRIFFFTQNGQVPAEYSRGALSNPVHFVGSTP